jgi:hypothetical protein
MNTAEAEEVSGTSSPEPLFPGCPLMIVGEGTNEIQRNVIAGQLVSPGGLPR